MAKEFLEFELKADTWNATKEVKRFEDDIEGFRKRIQDKKAIELSLNVAEIKSQIDTIKTKIKEVDDEEVKIQLQADTERLKQQLTQANRELRNYARTGEKDISVLGKLFQGVSNDIDKTRLELLKLWKSTSQLDAIEKELNQVNQQFKEGKISIQEYGAKLNSLQGNITNTDGVFSKFKNTLKSTAGFFIAGLGMAEAIGFAKQSVEEFAKFEKGLARINTVANVTKQEMEVLGSEIKNISVTFGLAKDELLETWFNISSAGVQFQNVSSILKLSAITAVGAGTDTTTAFNGIIAVLKKYGENINQAGAVAEKFFIANKIGQTTIEDMANAIQNLTSSAKPAGVSMNEVFAVLATLTGVTWDANAVITQLNGAINALAAPTTESSKLFKELGIEVGQDAIAKKGLVAVSKEVYDAVGGNQEALRKLIPEIEASKLIVALATTQNDLYKKSLDEVTTGQGNLEQAVSKMADTTEFKLEVAGKKWDNFKVKTGQVLVTIGGFLIDLWNVVISTFKIFGKVLQNWVNAILGLTDVTFSALWDIVYNWKEFARVIPEYVKQALNNLPEIMSAWIRAMLNKLPWGVGDKIADKLGLDTFWNIFKDVDTNFNFKNTTRAFNNMVDNAVWFNEEIAKEWNNITSIVSGNSKEQQLAIQETIDEIENLNQSFWSTEDAVDNTAESQANLNKILWWTSAKSKELTEEEKKQKKALEDTKKAIQDKANENEKTYDSIMDDIDKWVDSLEKYIDEIEKVNDKIKELKDDATSNIRDINNELAELGQEETNKLGERYVEILKKELDLKDELAREEDGEKSRKIQEELNNLAKERKFIIANTTEEQRKQAEELSKLSEAELIIKESSNKEAILEERKKIYEAILNGEKINLDLISDYENLKLAEQLSAKQIALDTELQALTTNLDLQRQELLKINEDKKNFEMEWTAFFGTEIQKQTNYAKQLQAELKRIIALQKEAGIQGVKLWNTATAETEAKINGMVDNSKKVDVNINATSNVDIDYAVTKISETLK